MSKDLKTDHKFLERLKSAAAKPVSIAEIRKQRVSFVYGNLPADSSMTRQQVRVTLERLEGVAG